MACKNFFRQNGCWYMHGMQYRIYNNGRIGDWVVEQMLPNGSYAKLLHTTSEERAKRAVLRITGRRKGGRADERQKCPVDRGKLLIGLECHRHDDDKCSDCQYGDPADIKVPCGIALADDALAYIGYLEAKYDKLAVENADLREQLEQAKLKGAYLTMYEDGEDILFDCGKNGDTDDFRLLAMA